MFWAGNGVLGRAVRGDIPPVGLAFWRWTLASLVLAPFAWRYLLKDIAELKRRLPVLLLLAFLGVGAFNTLLYTGLQYTIAINSFLLQSLLPAVVVLLSRLFFANRVTAAQLTGIFIAFLGASVIIFQGSLTTLQGFRFNPGDLIIFAGVVLYATYTALLRKRPQVHPLSFLLATFILGVPMIFPFYIWELAAGRGMTLGATTVLSLLYVAVFPSILSYLFYNRGVELLGANRAGLSAYLMPVFGSVLAVLLLGESFRWFHALGIGFIAAGVTIANRFKPVPRQTS